MLASDWAQHAIEDIPPVAGYYAFRPGSGHWTTRPLKAVYIWHGPPPDPITGLEMDRSHRWQALLDGNLVDITEVWPACGRRGVKQGPITEAEYEELLNG